MQRKITKIIYWKDKRNNHKDNLYYIQVEYENNFCEVGLITEEDFEEIKSKYKDIMQEAE